MFAGDIDIDISRVVGLHCDPPLTTEPIYVTAKSTAALAPYSPRNGLFYGCFRARKSRLMILCILPATSQLYSTCPPYPPYLLESICAPPSSYSSQHNLATHHHFCTNYESVMYSSAPYIL